MTSAPPSPNLPLLRPKFTTGPIRCCSSEALSEEERMVRDSAHAYCQEKLFPRVLAANRHERFDREIMNEMGALGFLGSTSRAMAAPGSNYVCLRADRARSRAVDSGYRSAMSVQSSLVMHPIHGYGSEEQRQKAAEASHRRVGRLFRPDRARSRLRPGGMMTRADGRRRLRLTGAKMWIANSPIADVCWCGPRRRTT